MPQHIDEPDRSGGTDFRTRLRETTKQAHALLDERLSVLDLATPEDRRAFCRIQLKGFRRLGAACDWQAAEATDALRSIVDALETEEGEDRPVAPVTGPRDAPLDADAVAYVTLGSQLGTAMLRRQIPEDARTGLFAVPQDTSGWRGFCDRITRTPPDPDRAARIERDATRAFEIFLAETRHDSSLRTDQTT